MRPWTICDGFVTVAATVTDRPKTSLEQGETAELWKDHGSLVSVAATGCGAA